VWRQGIAWRARPDDARVVPARDGGHGRDVIGWLICRELTDRELTDRELTDRELTQRDGDDTALGCRQPDDEWFTGGWLAGPPRGRAGRRPRANSLGPSRAGLVSGDERLLCHPVGIHISTAGA